MRSAADLVEVLWRAGEPAEAAQALRPLEGWSIATGGSWSLALAARCRALLSDVDTAEAHFVAALRWHAETGRRFDEARTALVFGEWLRRRRRRIDARSQLRRAHEDFRRMGAVPWAERAAAELRATGESTHSRAADTLDRLTPQELQIVQAVALGATNREVATQLFLSPRTVDYHLHKVFAKLGVASRKELILRAAR